MAGGLSIAGYARHRKAAGLSGGTEQAVSKALASGRISRVDGGIDPDIADMQWRKNTRRRADYHGRAPSDGEDDAHAGGAGVCDPPASSPSWAESKARTEAAMAGLRELELAERQGALIDRAGYELAARQAARMLRDALVMSLPTKVAPVFAGMADPREIESSLRDAIRTELSAMSRALEVASAAGE